MGEADLAMASLHMMTALLGYLDLAGPTSNPKKSLELHLN